MRNSQICAKNGSTNWTSRYSTFMAENHKATPREVNNTITSRSGTSMICQPGKNPNHIIITRRIVKVMAKSTTPPNTAAAGSRMRGKYTLVTSDRLLARLMLPSSIARENTCQGTMAAKANRGYGSPPVGILPILPSRKEKIATVASGWTTTQAMPMTVCLYRTAMSRTIKATNRSRQR